jgi:asparagine synthase (glutamine-hydrolysing)
LSGLIDDVLSAERLSLHGYFNRDYITTLVSKFMKGDDALTFRVWTLIVFQLWYEQHLGSGETANTLAFETALH